MKKIGIILTAICSILVIIAAFYRFDYCKVNNAVYAEDMAVVNVQLLEIHRRNLVQRIYDFTKAHPNFKDLREYHRLMEDLRRLDLKINKIYKGKG